MKKRSTILNHLSLLPRKMLLLYDLDAIAELVLHDLCSEQCFNLRKAVYFVDNPDFDCMKGIAGFCSDEAFKEKACMWEQPDAFVQYIKKAPYNQKVRSIQQCSMKRSKTPDEEIMRALAQECAIEHPKCHVWDMKHDNRGIFIYESADDADVDECIEDGVCLLSFCPIN